MVTDFNRLEIVSVKEERSQETDSTKSRWHWCFQDPKRYCRKKERTERNQLKRHSCLPIIESSGTQ